MQRAARCLLHSRRAAETLRGQSVRYYYVKKKKRGPSGQAWLALAGVTTTITGVGIVILGARASSAPSPLVDVTFYVNISGRPEETIEGLDTVSQCFSSSLKCIIFLCF